jgi:hypothetical protein
MSIVFKSKKTHNIDLEYSNNFKTVIYNQININKNIISLPLYRQNDILSI